MAVDPTDHPKQKAVIGIVGGLGPYAHLALERMILDAACSLAGARGDQDFPEWVLSAVPQTPDRTLAIRGEAPDPTPWLVRSLRRLESHTRPDGTAVRGADFAVIACNTAHHFLPAVREAVSLPIVHMIETTARRIAREHAGAVVGVLATTGTLLTGLYHDALREAGLRPVSLLDLPEGESLQRSHVMEPIYGPWSDAEARHTGGGIKGTGPQPAHTELLEAGGRRLVEAFGATVLVAGCTEIPLALPGETAAGAALVDPMRVVAEAAVRRAFGLSDASP